MGIYMEGIKIGYSRSRETYIEIDQKPFLKKTNYSKIKVSRLGGNPVELATEEVTLYESGRPLETIVTTKMSQSENILKAVYEPGLITFWSGESKIKELAVAGEYHLSVPLENIISGKALRPGKVFDFNIVDFLSYSLVTCRFSVVGRENLLILGENKPLWHVRTDVQSMVPAVIEEWMDEQGEIWKSVSRISFLTTTSLRMKKDKALEESSENFDIAYSTVIRPNLEIESPREVRSMTVRLSGLPEETIKEFPFDESQRLISTEGESMVVETHSQIFREKDSPLLPIKDAQVQDQLRPTTFIQSDQPGFAAAVKTIIDGETNAWKAAKKIAIWVRDTMTPNYNIGFATAREVLENPQGDCSEHTVLTVALCRAAGLPARAAVGIMYADGIFAYHMWPEVFIGRWIGLDAKWLVKDKTSRELYTDATHIKFGHSDLDENLFNEMAGSISSIIGSLKLEILGISEP